MYQSVNANVLTNQIDILSDKTHEVTRCKQVQCVLSEQWHTVFIALALYKVYFALDLAHPTLSCVYGTVLFCQ